MPRVTRCFKCHRLGHVAAKCDKLGIDAEICRRCGKDGHTVNTCTEKPCCVMCIEAGHDGREVEHVAGTWRCRTFREEVEKRKRWRGA